MKRQPFDDIKIEHEIEEEITEEKSIFKKVIFLIIGLILITMFVSFVFVSYPVGNILAGRSESALIKSNVIFLSNFKIILENGTYEKLEGLYFNDRTKEISICMQGYKNDDDYYISSFYQPTVYDESVSHVSFEPCSSDTLIMLHTHPFKHCIGSDTDMNTLDETKKNNPNVVMVVMCEAKRFSVYS